MNSTPSSKEAQNITLIGLAVNLLLSLLKFWLGFWGRSHAVVADGVHSLSDMGTDLLVLLGIKYWSAPADDSHPYGHQRIETVITLGISLILAGVGIGLGWDAIYGIDRNLKNPPLLIAVLGPLVSMVAKEILFRRTRAVGKKMHSSALIANAWHHRSDALSSIPALLTVAIASMSPRWAFLDSIGALIIATFVLKMAWTIAAPALSELMDHGAGTEDLKEITLMAESVSGVRSVHRLRTRRVGSGWFVDLHAEVDPEMTVRESHDIATALQNKLLEDGPAVADVTVHIEPDESK